MAKLTPKQQQALAWYVEEHGLIPQLSSHPVYRFTVRKDPDVVRSAHIMSIVTQFDAHRKKEKEA